MEPSYPEIFQPLRIKGVVLRNRVVAPPMFQVRPTLSPEGIAWHRRLAGGGAAMVIVEGTSVRKLATKHSPGDLRPLVEAIHDQGAAAAIQLFPVIADDVADPDAPTAGQIEKLIEQFAAAARLCREAGFDAVEPHGAHGYLLNQFFMPDKNHRTDRYGGSPDGRGRLGEQIVAAMRRACGPELLILFRHTPTGGGYTIEDSFAFVERLIDAGLDVLDISPARDKEVADVADRFKRLFNVPVIAVGGMEDPAAAAEALRLGRCDLVGVGRQLIADASWPEKVRQGRLDEIVACAKCDKACFGHIFKGEPAACVQWDDEELTRWVC